MLLERPEIEKALEAIFQKEGLSIRRILQKHAGGKWQLRYASVLGGNGNLEVDVNYMFRMPLYASANKSFQQKRSPTTLNAYSSIENYRDQLYEVLPLWHVSFKQP